MERSIILETTFLIDFERERLAGRGATMDFLKAHAEERLYITDTIAGELACGSSLSARVRWEGFIRPFGILEWTSAVNWHYGEIYRYLKMRGQMIGTNDIWIAATALEYECPLVTANTDHFRRVPNLVVLGYR